MNLKDYKTQFINALLTVVEEEEANSFFYIALDELMHMRRVDLVLQEVVLSAEQLAQWQGVLEQLLTEKPIQYVFSKAYFYGLEFSVNEHTLIPRPETEELVEWIIHTVKQQPLKQWRILDIGTGSGCIPVTLAKNISNAVVTSMDVSEKALEVAKRNADHNGVSVRFLHQDVLKTVSIEEYDLIVSNPPYVRHLEKIEIQKNVLGYEPHLALFVDDSNPLLFYRKITELADAFLAPGGHLFFEINQYLANETLALFENTRLKTTELRKDMRGNDRMVHAEKK
ncbi:peptide chain release factor N(5)-glutamine methyltransferase [Myroides ceti]|uniref:Release factor glutamine methyltransferase n=1 Tax=Paenimyroides ceti TaxID=395087 RepID=A0ABT8D2M3_9FLAO|nr:peptide chain release factor N(5)-glutamine methyltransferase [Paenimyroides ceti]MDN3707693.1 peptide chain release factor N(5)-glutamine methyltransferase [Paenimyroides ceti]MDN3710112.1 peptide chain release factor N(5)-glutamine methyltransferase [Paenimyroides ceti]